MKRRALRWSPNLNKNKTLSLNLLALYALSDTSKQCGKAGKNQQGPGSAS